MQCFLIFDHLNDVVYVKSDTNFNLYIRKKLKEEDLIQDESGESRSDALDYHNALVQFFSPFLASQRIMINQFNNPYTGMQCEDGTILVFAEYLGFMSVVIGRGEGLTETLLRRKMEICLRLSKLVCGPTWEILKTSHSDINERREFLGELIDTWYNLYFRELSFLLEAEEQLITNSDLSAIWIKLLQNVLEKVRTVSQGATTCHAFILVNCKILALYSSRNACALSGSDILLLIILACTRQADLMPSLMPVKIPCPRSQESTRSSDSEQFYSPCDSPTHLSQAMAVSTDLSAGVSKLALEERSTQKLEIKDDKLCCTLKKDTKTNCDESTDGFVDIAAEFSCDLVFLQSSVSRLAPHLVYTVQITQGIVLVMVSVVNRIVLSGCLVRGIDTLYDIQRTIVSLPSKSVMESLESTVRSIVDSLKKLKISSTENDLNLKRLHSNWSTAKKNELFRFLKSRDLKCLSPRLETELIKLSSLLKEFFQKYCINWFKRDKFLSLENGPFIDAQALVRYTLADYVEYLQVKARQNVSMAPYYSEFPGLVHFIYVDRIKNQITLPTICTEVFESAKLKLEKSDTEPGDIVWKKLYGMVNKAWKFLQSGYTSAVWRDDCFHYSYFIWFEDAVGNLFNPEVKNLSDEELPLPGTIAKNFYRQFIKVCFPSNPEYIRCYELFCIHLSTVPATTVHQHARRLTAKVWEISGGAQSPVDLL